MIIFYQQDGWKWSDLISRKIYTAGTNFTRPPVVTVVTNLHSGSSLRDHIYKSQNVHGLSFDVLFLFWRHHGHQKKGKKEIIAQESNTRKIVTKFSIYALPLNDKMLQLWFDYWLIVYLLETRHFAFWTYDLVVNRRGGGIAFERESDAKL